jgi:glycosyltransferase involved in cell wall biosynthesis
VTIDATILIPTFNHADLLPYALRSALAQDGVTIEVFVVGDGVGDDTRAALEPFLLADERVRFFDLPKGERHGERHRHEALREASGEAVCYLGDDDILLQGHVSEMLALLSDADFAHSFPVYVLPDGALRYHPGDLSRPEFLALIRSGENFISLTGSAHTRTAYERLPYGWRPAPPDTFTDLYMWQQFCALPGFRGATGSRLSAIHFPDPDWRMVDSSLRRAELEKWLALSVRPDADAVLHQQQQRAILLAAQDFRLAAVHLSEALESRREAPWMNLAGESRLLAPIRALRRRLRVPSASDG